MRFNKLPLIVIATTVGSIAFAQSSHIKGRITDESKSPIANVTIQLQNNPNIKAVTDAQGFYYIEVPKNEFIMDIYKDGFDKKSVNIHSGESVNENGITYINLTIRPNNTHNIQEVVITDNPSLVANSVFVSTKKLDNIAGGTNLAQLTNLTSQRSQTLKDALQRMPGVIIQEFFGGNDQPRLNIRGSGIQSNPQSRGVALLQDGIPINFSDGSYIIGVLEPQASNLVEVYRGANALEFGGATLGGAMNFITKNGYNASPLSVKLEGGSFGYYNIAASSGFAKGKNDGFVSVSYNNSNGFREYNTSRRLNALANIGRKFSDKLESRLYASFTDLYFDIPGPLTFYQLSKDPRQINKGASFAEPFAAGPNVFRDRPNRNSKILRIGSRTAYKINDNSLLTGTIYYQYADDVFTYPSYVRASANNDYGVRFTYENRTERNYFTAGLQISQGTIHQNGSANVLGKPLHNFLKNDLIATHNVFYANNNHNITDKLTLALGVQVSIDNREIRDIFPTPNNRQQWVWPSPNAATNGKLVNWAKASNISKEYNFFGINPKIGLIYKLNPNAKFYTNFSRSYEPPTFLELINVSGSSVASSPSLLSASDVKGQKAYTFEVGTKGHFGKLLHWDLSFYNAWVEDEVLSITGFGVSAITINSPYKTIHRGLEAEIKSTFAENIFSNRGDSFTFFANYNWADFYFRNEKKNQIAGVPEHYSFIALDYKHPSGFFAEANIESIWKKTPTDHQNTLYQDPYQILGAKIGFKWNRWTFFVQGNNLTNKIYASSYLIRDKALVPPLKNPQTKQPLPTTNKNFTAFIPGVERNFVAGINFIF